MNLGDLTGLVEKPIAAVSSLLNTPNSAGRYRPFYLQNVVDALSGRTLEDAVRDKTILITGGSSGIGIHDYQRTMQLNYLGAVQLILKFIPGMRERGFGQIINMSSAGVQTRAPRFGAYIASKAALDTLCDSLQAETVSDGVRFTTVYMALVKPPMIGPTKVYDKFPTLSPDQAAGVLADAIVHRPRRMSPPFRQFASLADSVNPMLIDFVRNRAFTMFDDSAAAQGDETSDETPKFDKRSEAFVRATRGIHW